MFRFYTGVAFLSGKGCVGGKSCVQMSAFKSGFWTKKISMFWRLLFASHEYFIFQSEFCITLILLFSRDLRRSQFRKIKKVISSKNPTKKQHQRNVKFRLKNKILMWCEEKASKHRNSLKIGHLDTWLTSYEAFSRQKSNPRIISKHSDPIT